MDPEDIQLDIPGATLLLGATSCLNLALQWGGIVYPWSNANVFGCLIGFGLLTMTFLYLQFRAKERLVHLMYTCMENIQRLLRSS